MKIVRESLNEGRFSCTIEDLHKAVSKYVNSELSSFGDRINVSKDSEHILITYKGDIKTDMQWLNLSDEEILKKVKNRAGQFKNRFMQFKDFCTSGLRGVADTFRKSVPIVDVNVTCQLDKLKYKTNKDNWHAGERRIFRYSDTGINDLTDEKTYIDRNGKENLNMLTISVGIFLRNI